MQVKVIGGFHMNGTLQTPGSTIEVSDYVGHDLIARSKVERVAGEQSPAAASGPMTTNSVPGLVQGKAPERRR